MYKLKKVYVTALFFMFAQTTAHGMCLSRYGQIAPDSDPPIFVLENCAPALEYIEKEITSRIAILKDQEPSPKFLERLKLVYDHILGSVESDDLAIRVRPVNASARAFMLNKDDEHMHFRGSCESVTLFEPVNLVTDQHCSDTGLTLVSLLSDITIIEISRAKLLE